MTFFSAIFVFVALSLNSLPNCEPSEMN